MGAYVIIAGNRATLTARALLGRASDARAGRSTWSLTVQLPHLAVLTAGPNPPAVRLGFNQDRLVVGEVFTNAFAPCTDERLINLAGLSPEMAFARLRDDVWGRYVALARAGTEDWAIFRDPSGGLDCLTWSSGDLQIIASDLPGWLSSLFPGDLAVNESQLALMLAAPCGVQGASPLDSVTAVHPGEMHDNGATRQLWSPAGVVRRGLLPAREAPRRLKAVVDGCVSALAAHHGPAIVEISGGLDSAIIAASVKAAAAGEVVSWSNLYIDDLLGDERAFATCVADHLNVPLDIGQKLPGHLDIAALRALGPSARPALAALDSQYDLLVSERARQTGACTLFTGQGGDTLLFNLPTDLIAIDRRRDHGLFGLLDGDLVNLARWTHRSVWLLLAQAVRPPSDGSSRVGYHPLAFANQDGGAAHAEVPPHPWLADLAGIPPAKRLQIHSLTLAQRLNGPCRRSGWVDAIHPLLTQPVVELCLRLSTADLTMGGRDRGLARLAFANRLPDAVRQRRTKGDGTAYLGRMVEASLPDLRPLLLEGELARRGLLDLPGLEAMLCPDYLIGHGGYADFLDAAAIEVWLRMWAERGARPASGLGAAGAASPPASPEPWHTCPADSRDLR